MKQMHVWMRKLRDWFGCFEWSHVLRCRPKVYQKLNKLPPQEQGKLDAAGASKMGYQLISRGCRNNYG